MERDRSFLAEYRLFSGDIGARVLLRNPRTRGTVLDIDADGKLILQKKDGNLVKISSAKRIRKLVPRK